MVITGSSLNSLTWKTLYNVISGEWLLGSIYASWPDPIAGKPPSFPLAVLDAAEVDGENLTLGTNMTTNEITVPVTVYTKARQQLDIASDQIGNAVRGNRQILAQSGLGNITLANGGQGTEVIGDRQKIHFKTLLIGGTFNE